MTIKDIITKHRAEKYNKMYKLFKNLWNLII